MLFVGREAGRRAISPFRIDANVGRRAGWAIESASQGVSRTAGIAAERSAAQAGRRTDCDPPAALVGQAVVPRADGNPYAGDDASTGGAGRDPPAAPKELPPPARPTKVTRKPFDPIKEHGEIFVGWKKPKVAIAITGMEHGYIEPCGCAGIERMTGGMSRRYSFFEQLRKEGWPLVALDVGGLARGYGLEAELKFSTLVEGKMKMGYNAVGFGGTISGCRRPTWFRWPPT